MSKREGEIHRASERERGRERVSNLGRAEERQIQACGPAKEITSRKIKQLHIFGFLLHHTLASGCLHMEQGVNNAKVLKSTYNLI